MFLFKIILLVESFVYCMYEELFCTECIALPGGRYCKVFRVSRWPLSRIK